MNPWIILGLILGLLFVGSVTLDYELYVNNYFNPLTPYPLAISTVNAADSLNLTMTLNATSILQGQSIEVTIGDSNVLNTTNTVTASSNWPLLLSLGPCSPGIYPMGLAIFKGYYTSSNISTAESLKLYQPGAYACPTYVLLIASYTFQPLSDMAIVNVPNPSFNLSMSAGVTADGYWAGTSAKNFTAFPPGTYTVAGGDEWGQLVILHFDVT